MKVIKKVLKDFETTMAAVAFAEQGEFETAKEMMRQEEEEPQKEEKKDDKKQ